MTFQEMVGVHELVFILGLDDIFSESVICGGLAVSDRNGVGSRRSLSDRHRKGDEIIFEQPYFNILGKGI